MTVPPKPSATPGPAPRKPRGQDRGTGGDLLARVLAQSIDPGYQRAAIRRAERGPGSRSGRATASALTAIVLLAFGLLLAVAYRNAVAEQPESARARAELVQDVRNRRAETDVMQRRADLLREQVARARDEALAAGDPAEVARLRALEAGTGLAAVRGDGAVVTVSDAETPRDPVTGDRTAENLGRVFDRDLQDIVNALWRSGAEAISINGQRLAATSTIRTAGAAILVDFRPVTSPYRVQAIGPDELADEFGGSGTAKRFQRYVTDYRMGFSVRSRDDLTLPAAADPQLRYARPTPSPLRSSPGGTR